MGKSFLERLARGLGKSTGKLVEKAKEKGLDKKAGELVEKAQAKLKVFVKEYEDGQNEGREEREAGSGEDEEHSPEGEGSKGEVSDDEVSDDEVSDDEVSEGEGSEGEVSESEKPGGAVEADEERREDEPTGESGGTRAGA